MAKYGKAAQKTVGSAMSRRKKGTLRSGSGQKVESREQAIAIGLSEARAKGGKVPRKRGAKKAAKNGAKKAGGRKRAGRKAAKKR